MVNCGTTTPSVDVKISRHDPGLLHVCGGLEGETLVVLGLVEGTDISHLWKGKIIGTQLPFKGDMLVPWRV